MYFNWLNSGLRVHLTVHVFSMLREVVISAVSVLGQLTQELVSLSISTVKTYGMYRHRIL